LAQTDWRQRDSHHDSHQRQSANARPGACPTKLKRARTLNNDAGNRRTVLLLLGCVNAMVELSTARLWTSFCTGESSSFRKCWGSSLLDDENDRWHTPHTRDQAQICHLLATTRFRDLLGRCPCPVCIRGIPVAVNLGRSAASLFRRPLDRTGNTETVARCPGVSDER
jgi:hypothetical protein